MQGLITILGSGTSMGVPTIGCTCAVCTSTDPHDKRTRPSVRIEFGGHTVLIDTGTDFRQQALREGITRVDAVLYTHAHADHISGIDEVRMLNRILGKPLPTYIAEATLDYLRNRYEYAFRPHSGSYFFRPVLEPILIAPGDTVEIGGRPFQIFEQDHEVLKSVGFRCGNFAYSTDVVRIADSVFDLLAGVDTWLLAAFQRKPHFTHLSVDQALGWSRRVGARRTVLTHMGNDLDWGWLQQRLPEGAEAGFDGMVIDVAE